VSSRMTTAEALAQPALQPSPARVRGVSVKRLFGWLDHRVELRHEERVTILLGPNGVGKTRLLELVAAAANARVDELETVPFEELRIDFDDGQALVVRKALDDASPNRQLRARSKSADLPWKSSLKFLLFNGKHEAHHWVPEERADPSDPRAHRGRFGMPPWMEPAGLDRWYDGRTGRRLTVRQVALQYGLDEAAIRRHFEPPKWMHDLFDHRPVHLIETQRLLRLKRRAGEPVDRDNDAPPVPLVVNEVAEELARRVVEAQGEYAREDQRLQKTYVERLLRAKEAGLRGPELKARLAHLAERRTRLEGLGLLAADPQESTVAAIPAASLPPDQYRVLDLFADDLESKLNVLEPLARSIELLLGSINAKFRNKRLLLAGPLGLVVMGEPRNRLLTLEALSSGEQHELVLLFDLIFRVDQDTLVLLDEPELSLHPEWQSSFVDDLMSIARNSKFDVVLATHSPYIVNSHIDLVVELRSDPQG
jgi:ABC-type lipoprotein export system ATPase subunit